MEEQQPLLRHDRQPSASNRDIESGAGGHDERGNGDIEDEEEEEKQLSRREWMAEKLESRALHKAVITLVRLICYVPVGRLNSEKLMGGNFISRRNILLRICMISI